MSAEWLVTEEWPGYVSYEDAYTTQAREPYPAAADTTYAVQPDDQTTKPGPHTGEDEKKETVGFLGLSTTQILWLVIILLIGSQGLFERKDSL